MYTCGVVCGVCACGVSPDVSTSTHDHQPVTLATVADAGAVLGAMPARGAHWQNEAAGAGLQYDSSARAYSHVSMDPVQVFRMSNMMEDLESKYQRRRVFENLMSHANNFRRAY